jgi:aspartyl-tRNA(Asn)/glutamyl-tRNA(Gln) amidotransferase subunit A
MTTPIAPASDGFPGITAVSELIRQGRISPVEVVTTCLTRIERLQGELNAFITVATDSALQAARVAEKEIQQGRWIGPLHGIPIGIKDFFDTADLRTTAAFEPFRNRVPRKDAVSVEKLKRAGAIIIRKMNMHTLGMGTTGLDSCFGPVKNPWNADYIPGGSSSGSAAALASGLCYASLDTDAIGSCRLPAACCGVTGFKGSYGLISMNGLLEGEQPPDDAIRWLSHAGITARSVEDAAQVLDVLAERAGHGTATSFRDGLTDQKPLRLGVAENFTADKDVREVFDQAVATLRTLGHRMTNARAPLTDFSKGIANIESDRQEIPRLRFDDIDVLVLPTTVAATLTVEEAAKNPLALSPEHTMFANYYGLPAISVRCGFDSRGLPLGLQVVARPGDDDAALRLAYQFERA